MDKGKIILLSVISLVFVMFFVSHIAEAQPFGKKVSFWAKLKAKLAALKAKLAGKLKTYKLPANIAASNLKTVVGKTMVKR